MWTFPSFESLRQDVRYAIRTLRRAPAFTIVALLALTLGIAGNTAIFSLVDAVRIRALPYVEPEQLVVLWGNVMRTTLERRGASYPDFLDWRSQAHSFEGMAAQDETMMTLSGVGEAKRIHVETVLGGVLSAARVSATLGRTFSADEDAIAQKNPLAVLSDGFWRREFGGDPQIVGRAISLNAQSFTITGCAGRVSRAERSRRVWIPFVMSDSAEALAERGNRGFQVLARLRPGNRRRRADGARHHLAASRAGVSVHQREARRRGQPARRRTGRKLPSGLASLMVAVTFVLLIACAMSPTYCSPARRPASARWPSAPRSALGGRGCCVR